MVEESPYRIRPDQFSAVEKQYFRFLLDHFSNGYVVLAKVALTDIFTVDKPNENVKYAQKLQQKGLDFLLLDAEQMAPVLAIELDDPKQNELGSTARLMDDVCDSAGLEILHVVVAPFYEAEPIKRRLAQILGKMPSKEVSYAPVCPHCGITMVLRFDKQGPINGNKYYGCLNYPECTEKIPVPTSH